MAPQTLALVLAREAPKGDGLGSLAGADLLPGSAAAPGPLEAAAIGQPRPIPEGRPGDA